MIGFVIGFVSGTAQFWLLSRYTRAITGGRFDTKLALVGVLQFFIPLIVLLAVAFLRRDELLTAGIGMAAALLGCAVISFLKRAGASGGGK